MIVEPRLVERRVAFLALGAVVFSVGLAIYVLFRTVRDLADTRDASGIATALGRLLLISAGAGVVASMILEFAKRIGPLRRVFHARQVTDWFGEKWSRGPGSPIEFGAPLEILTAQLAIRFRSHPEAVGGVLGSQVRDEIKKGESDHPPSHDDFDDPARPVDLTIERWLDSFHVATRARWTHWMRLASSGIAATLAGFAAAAANSKVSVVVGLAAAGLVIGGPFAWTTRDIVRIIERRSSP